MENSSAPVIDYIQVEYRQVQLSVRDDCECGGFWNNTKNSK